MARPVGSVVCDVAVDNAPPSNGILLDLEIRQGPGCHDLAFVRVEYPRPYGRLLQKRAWPDGAPVTVTWGRVPNLSQWFGYINHHIIDSDSDTGRRTVQVTYVMVGTSIGMDTERNRSWKNYSYSYIAKKLAEEHNLRPIIHTCPNPSKGGYEMQAGESDFTFLNRLADKVGFYTWASNSNLYFVDPNVILTNRSNSIPYFWSHKAVEAIDTLVNFKITKGAGIPGRRQDHKTAYGIDEKTGRVLQAGSGSGQARLLSDEVIGNYAEARQVVQGKSLLEQTYVEADIKVIGDPSIRTNRLIELGGNALLDGSGGYWLVKDARHYLRTSIATPDKDVFTTSATVTRNSAFVSSYTDKHVLPQEDLNMFLREDKWVAASLEGLRYA